MRLLLDTHALLWAKAEPARLSDEARAAIIDPANEVLVSLASGWELCVKAAAGKLLGDYGALIRDEETFRQQLEASDFELLPIDASHVFAALRLPMHHRDPFDRLLVAQAWVEDLVLVTRDDAFAAYGPRLMRA